MTNELMDMLELQVQNVAAVKKGFTWQYTLIQHMAALLYTIEGRQVDVEAIKEGHALLKSNIGAFSSFRGNLAVTFATLLSLSGARQNLLEDTLEVYALLKKAGFMGSDYLAMAAYQIASQSKNGNYAAIAERARAFYKGMKQQHYLLTGCNDYIFCAMLALEPIDVEAGLANMAELHAKLKPDVFGGDRLQALTQILVATDAPAEVPGRVLRLRDAFKAAGWRMHGENTFPLLGILAQLPVEDETIVNDVAETASWLRGQRGFGAWSLSKQELLLFASSLVAVHHTHQLENGVLESTLTSNIASIIIAQQAMIIAIVAATSTTATASSSSSR